MVGGIGTVAEDLEEPEVADELGRGGESLDLRGLEELGKQIGVGSGCRADDKICCCPR